MKVWSKSARRPIKPKSKLRKLKFPKMQIFFHVEMLGIIINDHGLFFTPFESCELPLSEYV